VAWACKDLIQTKSDWGPLGEKSDMTKLKEETMYHYTILWGAHFITSEARRLQPTKFQTHRTVDVGYNIALGSWPFVYWSNKKSLESHPEPKVEQVEHGQLLIEKYWWKIAGIQSRVHLELRMKHIWFVIGGAWWVASPMWWPQSKVETLGWPQILGYCLSMFSINSINHSTIQHSWGI
jgi:hypothetical protein